MNIEKRERVVNRMNFYLHRQHRGYLPAKDFEIFRKREIRLEILHWRISRLIANKLLANIRILCDYSNSRGAI